MAGEWNMLGVLFVWKTILLVLALLGVCWFLYYRHSRSKMVQLAKKFPSPRSLPLLGNALDFVGCTKDIFKTYIGYFQLGDTLAYWIGPNLVILTIEPSVIEEILGSTKYIDKPDLYVCFHKWLGTGLLTSTGQKWHSHRKILTPSFHFKILDQFVDVFNKCSEILIKNLAEDSSLSGFNILPRIALCTLDIILETAMGISLNIQNNKDSEYVKATSRIADIIHKRHFNIWLRPDFLFNFSKYKKEEADCLKILHGLSMRIIRERKLERKNKFEESNKELEEMEIGQKKRLAFLDLLIEASKDGKVLTDEEIREEVDTFMFEGHDTTATSISFCLFLLGCYSDVQEKAFEELKSIFGDSKRQATMQDLAEMKYLERCIKESLRLYPSVPMFARDLKEDVHTKDYTFPSGSTVVICAYMAHRNPKVFPNPEEFNPDNFLPEKTQGRHAYTFIPFSAGARNCIGQKFALLEEKVVVSSVLRNFRIESLQKPEELELEAQLVLKPRNGLRLKLTPRS